MDGSDKKGNVRPTGANQARLHLSCLIQHGPKVKVSDRSATPLTTATELAGPDTFLGF
jgi:hypothetical protein